MRNNDEPKNPRLSTHNKYKRRLKALSLSVDEFLQHAETKLDESISGKIYKKSEIEEIVAKAKELAALLPDPADAVDCPPIRDDFLEVLQQTSGNTDKIIADAEAFFKGLSKEEWDEMVKAYNKKP